MLAFWLNKADLARSCDKPDSAVKIGNCVRDIGAFGKIRLEVIFLLDDPLRFFSRFVNLEDLNDVVGVSDDRSVAVKKMEIGAAGGVA